MNYTITIQERSKQFAIRVINAYTQIIKVNHFNDAAAVLAKQFLRSGCSVGANLKEGISAQLDKDFICDLLPTLNQRDYGVGFPRLTTRFSWLFLVSKSFTTYLDMKNHIPDRPIAQAVSVPASPAVRFSEFILITMNILHRHRVSK